MDQSKSLPELLLRIEFIPGCAGAEDLVKRVQTRLHTAFNLRVPTAVAPPGSLPRFEMKASRWLVAKRPSQESAVNFP